MHKKPQDPGIPKPKKDAAFVVSWSVFLMILAALATAAVYFLILKH